MFQKIIFFDGICKLCNSSVDFILKHDRKMQFLFCPLQSPNIKKYLPRKSPLVGDAILLLDERGIHEGGTAVAIICKHLGGLWGVLGILLGILPRFVLRWGYGVIAKRRYRLFGKRETCRIPTSDEAARFL